MPPLIRTDSRPVFLYIASLILVLGSLTGIGIFNVRERENPEHAAVKAMTAFIAETRDRAIRSGGSYRLAPDSEERINISWADNCKDEKRISKGDTAFSLPPGVVMTETGWQLCFDEWGNASGAPEVIIRRGDHVRRIIIGPGNSVRTR